MCEINNNDVGRYLVFTGMIQRLHCDWIQWTERRNNKRYKVALIRIQYFSIKTTGESSRNKLNQNLVFPITSFSCCVRGDYCCPICSAHVKGKCYNLMILDVSIRDDKWHRRNLGPIFKNLTVQPFRYNWWWIAMAQPDEVIRYSEHFISLCVTVTELMLAQHIVEGRWGRRQGVKWWCYTRHTQLRVYHNTMSSESPHLTGLANSANLFNITICPEPTSDCCIVLQVEFLTLMICPSNSIIINLLTSPDA